MLTQELTNRRKAARASAFTLARITPSQLRHLNTQVASLQQTILTLQSEIDALRTELAAVQKNNALALDPFVSVNPNPQIGVAGPNIIFTGANIHIVSGSGATNDGGNPRGLGNLIIGYDEDTKDPVLGGPPLNPGDRGGSHNLVIGARHRFTQAAFGGLVVGEKNSISNTAASVSGGENNAASGVHASVSGGQDNTASGPFASISGGENNTASGLNASISGGQNNAVSGESASISGGNNNTNNGFVSSIIGGRGIIASASASFSIAPQPPFP